MRKENTDTDLGAIRIHTNVISSIAAIAAAEIDGVKRIGNNLQSGMLELLGKKSSGAIKVELDKNEEVRIEIPLIIKYGYKVPDIAARVQENVRSAIEKMTDLSVRTVDIKVKGIEKAA